MPARTLLPIAALFGLYGALPGMASADGFFERLRKFDAETFHDDMSEQVLRRANQIDNMFGDDRIDDEAQQSRIRVYTDLDWDEDDGTDVGIKARVHLVLPNTKERLRLEFNGADDDDELDDDDNDGASGDDEQERSLALNFVAERSQRSKTDLGLGVRYRDSSLVLYEKLRHRHYFDGDNWLPRMTNEVRHYGDTGWEYRGQLDFDRSFSESWFTRWRSELRWYENKDAEDDEPITDLPCNDGYCINQLFYVYQRFDNPNHAIAYDWLNYFVTEPDTQLDELQLRVRYRHRLKWDWLHFEVRPRLRFLEEDDYSSRWSLLFRVEGIFGYDDSSQIQFREVDSIIDNTGAPVPQ